MGWCNPCPSLCVWGISLLVRDLQTHHGVERKGNGDGRTSWTIWSLQLDWFPVWVWDLQKWTFNGRLTWNGYSWEFKSLQCHWTFLSSPSCCCFPFFNIVNPVLIEVTPLTQRFLFLFSCFKFFIPVYTPWNLLHFIWQIFTYFGSYFCSKVSDYNLGVTKRETELNIFIFHV